MNLIIKLLVRVAQFAPLNSSIMIVVMTSLMMLLNFDVFMSIVHGFNGGSRAPLALTGIGVYLLWITAAVNQKTSGASTTLLSIVLTLYSMHEPVSPQGIEWLWYSMGVVIIAFITWVVFEVAKEVTK